MSTTDRSSLQPMPGEAASALTSACDAADAAYAQGVSNLGLVQQARLSQARRAADDLASRYGAADPRVVAAQASVQASTQRVARINVIGLQAATPAPQVPAKGWVLHGRVFDAMRKPVARLTVFLVDSQKAFQQGYGFSYTDETGYFSIEFAGAEKKDAAGVPLFLEILDAKRRPIHLDSTALSPATGSATYLDVVLSDDRTPLGEPPAQARDTAMPPARTKR
jgi:hypothetical protein